MPTEQQARQIFLDWLKDIVQESIEDSPLTVWHYTNAAGLAGILSSDRLWASDSMFLNDAAERNYGIDLMMSALADVETAGLSDRVTDFMFGLIHPDGGILRPWLEAELRLFVTCFCTSGELLSQWRTYGGSGGGGYAIGFTPPGPLPSWGQSAPHYLTMRRVVYDRETQLRICTDLVTRLVRYLNADPQDSERYDGFASELVNGIAEVSTWCKDPAFAEEREWRLGYRRAEDLNKLELRHRPSGGLVVPFVVLPVPRGVGQLAEALPITHVRCGPSLEPVVKERGVVSLLQAVDRYGEVHVDSSSAPARL